MIITLTTRKVVCQLESSVDLGCTAICTIFHIKNEGLRDFKDSVFAHCYSGYYIPLGTNCACYGKFYISYKKKDTIEYSSQLKKITIEYSSQLYMQLNCTLIWCF